MQGIASAVGMGAAEAVPFPFNAKSKATDRSVRPAREKRPRSEMSVAFWFGLVLEFAIGSLFGEQALCLVIAVAGFSGGLGRGFGYFLPSGSGSA
jgi:hypothetical protein